jgi:uncharacterized membrane protein
MVRVGRYLAVAVLLLGVVSIAVGAVFVTQGISKSNWMKEAMREEHITYLLPAEEVAKGNVIDTAGEAQKVADTIREHRRNIAPTYQDLLAGSSFDPTNATQLRYAQALNMENYLYLAVLGFGVTDVVIFSGVFMIVVGIALGVTGVVLFTLARRQPKQVGASEERRAK